MFTAGNKRADEMKGADQTARGGDMAQRLSRIAVAADRRATSLPEQDPERAFHAAHCDLAMTRLARLHGRRRA